MIKSLNREFWILGLAQIIEKIAWRTTLIVLPIYISQKDVPGGLHWDHALKGLIYFWWAILQNITPVLSGGFADAYGRRRTLFVSLPLIIGGYLLIATQTEFTPFVMGVLLLGFGSGIFKPALQGSVASSLNTTNSAIGWGVYILLVNIASFVGPPYAKFLGNISWPAVFYGSAALFTLNFFFVALLKSDGPPKKILPNIIFRKIFKSLFKKEIILFVLIMSGFTVVYLQFYETMPNFIYDWVNSTTLAAYLPDWLTISAPMGRVIDYKWYYNLNSGFIVLFVIFMSWYFNKQKMVKTLMIGVFLATFGLFLAGFTMSAIATIAGFIIYTFGEMITNPKFTEFFGRIAPDEDKSLYLSYLNISWAIGLAGGSLLGGFIYREMGEKSGFAMDYISQKFPATEAITHQNAMEILCELTNMTHLEVTRMLWDIYDPWKLWIPFAVIGLISIYGLFIYRKRILDK